MLDVGDLAVEVGDEVVLIGRQGDDEITAAGVGPGDGHRSPTTIVCGIGPRVTAYRMSAACRGPDADWARASAGGRR